MEHPNVARLRQALDDYNRGDLGAMTERWTDDILWHVGGKHPLSGDYTGREAVADYFNEVRSLTDPA